MKLIKEIVRYYQAENEDYPAETICDIEPRMHLENSITTDCTSTSTNSTLGVDDNMGYKINRKVSVQGKQYWIHANTEQEYVDRITLLMNPIYTDTVVYKEKHSFADYVERWFHEYSKPNIAEVTAITYKRQIDNYIIPAFGKYDIEDITTAMIQKMFNSMEGAKATKDKVKIVLNQILDWAVDDGYLAKNPMKSKRLKITGESSTPRKVYSVEQMNYIVSNIDKIKKTSDKLFIALLVFHPFRPEEALGLKWEDIDFAKQEVTISRAVTHPDRNQPIVKDTKTKTSHRTITLSSVVLDLLEEAENRTGFILGGEKPYSYTQVRKVCKRVEKELGFDEKITPSRFRPTVLTDLYDQTNDIKLTQQSAGHASSTTTLNHYVNGRHSSAVSTKVITDLYKGKSCNISCNS